ncbi:discriminator of mRNA degradation [Escherichia phage FL15]
MELDMVKAKFMGKDKSGKTFVINRTLFRSDLKWVTQQFAEVNEAVVACFVDDKKSF